MDEADRSVAAVLRRLEERGSPATLEAMGPKYGIRVEKAYGVSMADMKAVAKAVGTDHALAQRLWDTGWYEARMVAAMVDDPAEVTVEQMDRWAHDFDSWAICDTVCFTLFDRAAEAWSRVDVWAGSPEEYVKRSAFALLWSLALHDKGAPDARFTHGLDLVERESGDERDYVHKALLMAMRAIARRNEVLAAATREAAQRLAVAEPAAARRLGKQALRL